MELGEDLPDCVRKRTDTRQEKCSTFEEPVHSSLKRSGSDWLCHFRFPIWGSAFLSCCRGSLRWGKFGECRLGECWMAQRRSSSYAGHNSLGKRSFGIF